MNWPGIITATIAMKCATCADPQTKYYARSIVAPKNAFASSSTPPSRKYGALANPAWIKNAATTRRLPTIGKGSANLADA